MSDLIDRFVSWLYVRRIWGPRCTERELGCVVCHHWCEHDRLFNEKEKTMTSDITTEAYRQGRGPFHTDQNGITKCTQCGKDVSKILMHNCQVVKKRLDAINRDSKMMDNTKTSENSTISMDEESLLGLFIPLKSEYYEAFENGSKTVEYRLHGNRWHRGTCWAGRPVTISKGYGKKHRLSGVIKNVWLTDSIDLDPYIQIAIAEIYGAGQHGIICIEVKDLK